MAIIRRLKTMMGVIVLLQSLLLGHTAAAQPLLTPRERIAKVIEIIHRVPQQSSGRYDAEELLVTLAKELDPKDADEKLIDLLIAMLDDPTLRGTAVEALAPFDRLPIARKAIPKLLDVLPEEDCQGFGVVEVRTGIWVSDEIRHVLEDMGVQGRKWSAERPTCKPNGENSR